MKIINAKPQLHCCFQMLCCYCIVRESSSNMTLSFIISMRKDNLLYMQTEENKL